MVQVGTWGFSPPEGGGEGDDRGCEQCDAEEEFQLGKPGSIQHQDALNQSQQQYNLEQLHQNS